MSDHEHDESEGFYQTALPHWRFSAWDVAGIATTGVAGLFSVTGQALNLLAREFAAMANYSRQEFELRQAQREYDEAAAANAAALDALLDSSPREES